MKINYATLNIFSNTHFLSLTEEVVLSKLYLHIVMHILCFVSESGFIIYWLMLFIHWIIIYLFNIRGHFFLSFIMYSNLMLFRMSILYFASLEFRYPFFIFIWLSFVSLCIIKYLVSSDSLYSHVAIYFFLHLILCSRPEHYIWFNITYLKAALLK